MYALYVCVCVCECTRDVMDMASTVQIMDEADCISHPTNLPPAIGK